MLNESWRVHTSPQSSSEQVRFFGVPRVPVRPHGYLVGTWGRCGLRPRYVPIPVACVPRVPAGCGKLCVGGGGVDGDATACVNRRQPTSDHADSRTTRVATRASASGESAVSTKTVIHGSNEGQSPRLNWIEGRSASMSNGFLFSVTRLRCPRVRFKDTVSRISRFSSIFEPRQISAAFWLESNPATTEFAADGLACDQRTAVFATKQAASEWMLRLDGRLLPVLAGENILTCLECSAVDQRSVLAGIVIAASHPCQTAYKIESQMLRRTVLGHSLFSRVYRTAARRWFASRLDVAASSWSSKSSRDDFATMAVVWLDHFRHRCIIDRRLYRVSRCRANA